jgi:hypothetical protein
MCCKWNFVVSSSKSQRVKFEYDYIYAEGQQGRSQVRKYGQLFMCSLKVTCLQMFISV